MGFTSMVFLWIFLPAVLLVNILLPQKLRESGLFLLAASLLFYVWGEQKALWAVAFSVIVNFSGALFLDAQTAPRRRRAALAALTAVNLGLLFYCRYFNFVAALPQRFLGFSAVTLRDIAVPLGVSFYTFHLISYTADVYQKKIPAEKNPVSFSLYVMFFPKMVQGPIARYGDFKEGRGPVTAEGFARGARRFILGLARKVLIADELAMAVNQVGGYAASQVSGALGWYIGILYALQLYYDFSGYSDMAIGIADMLGFSLPENFNCPYLARHVGDFWRRWHMSLSGWFRDYLYIPLGGSRRGLFRTCVNLMIVFIATGIWHGVGSHFVLWGLYYGVLQVLERLFLRNWLDRLPAPVRYVYMFFVTVVGWTLFRAASTSEAFILLRQMFFLRPGAAAVSMFVTKKDLLAAAAGILFSGPLQLVWPSLRRRLPGKKHLKTAEAAALILLFVYCTMAAAGSTYRPFLYAVF